MKKQKFLVKKVVFDDLKFIKIVSLVRSIRLELWKKTVIMTKVKKIVIVSTKKNFTLKVNIKQDFPG